MTPLFAQSLTGVFGPMFQAIMSNLRQCWRKLLVADLVFKAIGVVLLAPIVSLTFRASLAASGRDVIADADIALFLLHPIGAFGALLLASLTVSIFAIELSILVTISIAFRQGVNVSIVEAIRFVIQGNGLRVLWLAMRVVMELVLWALPFLAAGGLFYWLLLTKHDINFYLSTQPTEFWIAAVCIGTCLVLMVVVLCVNFSKYFLAVPILFLEKRSPRDCLSESRNRISETRRSVIYTLLQWVVVSALVGSALTALAAAVGNVVIPRSEADLSRLVIAVGFAVGLVAISNLLSNCFSNLWLGSLMAMTYLEHRDEDKLTLPAHQSADPQLLGSIRVTPLRASIALAVAMGLALLTGRIVIDSFDLEDDVVITAHRGGAVAAPENTLAAIEQAIEDQADWVEIDVQESSDGVVLVVHDSDLMKVGGPPTKIWEATAEELQSVDIGSYHGEEFSDQRVPTLDQVLSACKDRVNVNIELKYYGHTQDLEAKVVDIVEAHEMQDAIVIMSLKQQGLDKIKSLRPNWTCGLLTAVAKGDLTKANADFLAVNASMVTRNFVQRAHSRGKDVAAWTLNDAHSLSVMISRGVDNLITDDPALARRVLADREAMSPADRMLLEVAYYFGVRPQGFEQ